MAEKILTNKELEEILLAELDLSTGHESRNHSL